MTYVKPENRAECHPHKKKHAKGLCAKCYHKKVYDESGFERYRDKRYQKEYGISLSEYNDMLSACDFRCEICGTLHREEHWKRLCVDHSHDTGSVRGLLCDDCNQLLGRSKDSIDNLVKAIDYLKKHDKKTLQLVIGE